MDDTPAALCHAIDHAKYDSLVSLLYAPGATLRPHVDKDLGGAGLAVSLGASATFDFGGSRTVLRSGDALFADFSLVEHAVLRTHPPDSAPAWWHDLPDQGRFGRSRCSLQLRDKAWALKPHPSLPPGKFVRRRRRLPTGCPHVMRDGRPTKSSAIFNDI